jgi:hypothetical protein
MEYLGYGLIAIATLVGLCAVFWLAAKVDLWFDQQAQRKRDRQTIFKRQLDRPS